MPTYQYACTACDERTEAVQRFTDAPLTECPVCGGALRKVFSAVGVVFKGSGFYKNDSRDSGKKATPPKEAAASSSGSSSDSASSDSASSSAGAATSSKGSSSDAPSGASSGSSSGASSGSSSGSDSKAPTKKAAAAAGGKTT